MKKKAAAQTLWIVVVAVLTIIGLLIIFPLFTKTKEISEDITAYRICKDGNSGVVLTRVKLMNWVIAEQGVKHCRTERVKIPSGKEYESIAKKMSSCWDQYLEGKEEIFETQDANYCAFCSVLEFDDKTKKLNGLTKYLVENKLPNDDRTYMSYLSEIEAKGEDKKKLENLELQSNSFIDTSKPQAIMFVMYKDAYPGLIGQPQGKLAFFGGIGGGTLGFLTGTSLGIYYLGAAALCVNPLAPISCFAGVALVTVATAAGVGIPVSVGYLIGSDRSADWSAKILLTEYNKQQLGKLNCTRLEGYDYLKIEQNQNVFKKQSV